MITKRDLIIVLATFCLTFALFMILPAGSNNRTSGTGQYDPWIDTNDDGIINIYDLVKAASIYGTEGDPTKNVNVTNWPNRTVYYWSIDSLGIPPYSILDIYNDTMGYNKVTVLVSHFSVPTPKPLLDVFWRVGNVSGVFDIVDFSSVTSWGKTYDVGGTQIQLRFVNLVSSNTKYVSVAVYMTN